jgi:hypothetical protein
MSHDRQSRRGFARLAAGLAALPVLGALPAGPALAASAVAKHAGLARMRAMLVPFATAPFPYHGRVPDTGKPFFDTTGPGGQLGHDSPRGGVYYEAQTYSDNHVLVALPKGFDLRKPAAIVVFFHGNQATLQRDVVGRQRVLDQLQDADLNAALIAPQLAVDALDSSAGRFWQRHAFRRFMAEAAWELAALWGTRESRRVFAAMPIILVAFSGGYDPAIYAASLGGVGRRIEGFVLLDALFGEEDRFARWIGANHRHAFFFSTYTEAAAAENADVMQRLAAKGIGYATSRPKRLGPGQVSFLSTPGVDHRDYVTKAWVRDPLTWIFDRVDGFPR